MDRLLKDLLKDFREQDFFINCGILYIINSQTNKISTNYCINIARGWTIPQSENQLDVAYTRLINLIRTKLPNNKLYGIPERFSFKDGADYKIYNYSQPDELVATTYRDDNSQPIIELSTYDLNASNLIKIFGAKESNEAFYKRDGDEILGAYLSKDKFIDYVIGKANYEMQSILNVTTQKKYPEELRASTIRDVMIVYINAIGEQFDTSNTDKYKIHHLVDENRIIKSKLEKYIVENCDIDNLIKEIKAHETSRVDKFLNALGMTVENNFNKEATFGGAEIPHLCYIPVSKTFDDYYFWNKMSEPNKLGDSFNLAYDILRLPMRHWVDTSYSIWDESTNIIINKIKPTKEELIYICSDIIKINI
jgi:hypothetical protein